MGVAGRARGGARQLAIALTGIALLSAGVPAAEAARSEFYGISSQSLDRRDRVGMALAKVGADRFPVIWRQVEPRRGSRDWSQVDATVGGLASVGIRPMPYLYGSPSWVGRPNKPPIDTAAHKQGWSSFLEAAVARYRPGGAYWTNPGLYHQQFGANATPLPIQAWQIWNEPTLDKFFHPGVPRSQLARKYGQLLQVSSGPIRSTDSQARIVLAGNPAAPRHGEPRAWDFLSSLYNQVPGVKAYFDVAALHPYGPNVDTVRSQTAKFRNAMRTHSDTATPLWITETGWGSGPPDQFGINKGPRGQAQHLTATYKMLLANRTAWNLQRVFWYLWRDPKPGSSSAEGCSFCGTAGLVTYGRHAKPALDAFTAFTTDATRPQATITAGPTQGSNITDTTPTFSFKSSEAGSTFQCRFDAKPFVPCASPYTAKPPLAKGTHTFSVKAIDAVGNESAVRSRSFKVV